MDAGNVKILFEDNQIIVAVKPPGVLSQADQTGDPDMLTFLKSYLKGKYKKPGNVYLGLVHRLDRMVGGVMVFARTSKAAARLNKLIAGHQDFKKTYLALVEGDLSVKSGTLRDYLLKDEHKNVVTVFDKPQPGAQEAILAYKVLESKDSKSLLKVNLQTGRPHQIRAQLSHVGHPIVGDWKYGSKTETVIKLWAYKLRFRHPVSQEWLEFTAEPDFLQK